MWTLHIEVKNTRHIDAYCKIIGEVGVCNPEDAATLGQVVNQALQTIEDAVIAINDRRTQDTQARAKDVRINPDAFKRG